MGEEILTQSRKADAKAQEEERDNIWILLMFIFFNGPPSPQTQVNRQGAKTPSS